MLPSTEINFFRFDNIQPVSRIPDRLFLHELVVGTMEKLFKEQGQIEPTWVFSYGSKLIWVKTPWDNNSEKDAAIQILLMLIKDLNSSCYSFVSEAWMANLSNEKDRADYLSLAEKEGVQALPEHLRDDVLMIHSYDRNRGFSNTRFKVTIRRKGLNFLGPRIDEDLTGSSFSGRMASLFDKLS